MPSRPDLPCADCGELMWSSTTSLPVGKARCRPCRKARPVHALPSPRKKKPPREWDCVVCGAHVVTTSAYGRDGKKCREHYTWKPLPCSTCGKQVYVKQHQRIAFCSSRCGAQFKLTAPYLKGVEAPSSQLKWRQCAACQRWMCNPRRRKYCTNSCAVAAKRIYDRESHASRRQQRRPPRLCIHCSADLSTLDLKRKACDPCRVIQRRKRRGKHNARARRYGVRYETVDARKVYARDGWRCGICHLKVDKHLAAPHFMSASLDHVVPLSLGGEHTYANTQCAHWICNTRKGALAVGEQLALIG